MKKIRILVASIVVSYSSCAADFKQALTQATQAFNLYAQHNPGMNEAKDVIEYLKFYQSFYSPVTPPPLELQNKIVGAAKQYVDRLKNIVEEHQFDVKPEQRTRIGQLGLKRDGKKLYEKSIALLKDRFIKKEPCCSDLAKMIDRVEEKRF